MNVSCDLWDPFPDKGWNPGPLHWEHGVLATGPPGKSCEFLFYLMFCHLLLGFPGGTAVMNLPVNAEDTRDEGSSPGLGRSLGEGNGNPLQYYCLGNPMDRRAWWATVGGDAKSQT